MTRITLQTVSHQTKAERGVLDDTDHAGGTGKLPRKPVVIYFDRQLLMIDEFILDELNCPCPAF